MHQVQRVISPWRWVPSTYFMEGLPFAIIVVVSTIMYKNFGFSNKEITFYTALLYLPWVIKPIWAWFVDLFKTKRWWIYTMEILGAMGVFMVALTLHTPLFFKLSLTVFWLCAFFSSSHDIAVDGFYLMKLNDGQQSFFVGIISLFYKTAKFFAGGLLVLLSGILLKYTNHDLVFTWTCIMLIAGGIMLVIGVYHYYTLPRGETLSQKNISQGIGEMKEVFIEFFRLKQIWLIIFFVMTFRLGETMVIKIVPLFILDSRSHGGLGFDNTYLGFSNIFIILSVIIAGILGGLCINRLGLKRCLLPMLLFVNLPHLIYIFLAYSQPMSQVLVLLLQIIEYFAITFSLTAYNMVTFYLVKDSNHKTAHYAFIAGIMVAAVMLPSMFSGALQQQLGFYKYFILVMFMMIPSLCLMPLIKVEHSFGKKFS
ncbi:MAG: MFS transporter [Burkholderiales bacterium]|nr:MFS transporter [Burkholderiales bacterium]